MKHIFLVMLLCGGGLLLAQPVITAPTQTDQLIIDNGTSNSADPGDRIRYKVTIQNTGSSPATGVQLNTSPDANTTFVSGSFKTSPVAVNDGPFACLGNVGITVAAASGVKANDFDDALASATLSVATAPTNGSVTLNNDGSFTYTPNPGFEGSDQFTYTLTDANGVGGGVPTTDQATVSITVSGMVWFVNASAGAGDGRLNTPFNSLASFNSTAADEAGDNIFLYTGSYSGGITLLNNQKLIGQGATSTLASTAGLTVPTHSNALPTTNGTAPTITNSGGNGVTLASGNTLNGFGIGNCSGNGLFGSAFGTVSVSTVSINSTGQAITLADGTANGSFTSVSSSGGANNILLNVVTCNLNLGSGALSGATGRGFYINGGSGTVSYSGSISNSLDQVVHIRQWTSGTATLSGNITATANGIVINSNSGGTINISGTSKNLNIGANSGFSMSSNTGATVNITGGGLVINSTTGTGFNVSGGGTITVQGSGNTINSTSGTALNVSNTTIGASGLTFQSISSGSGSATGIILDNTGSSGGLTVTGTGSAGSGGTIANKTGANGSTTTGIGIYLSSCSSVSLTRMQLNNFSNFGIRGFSVNNFAMDNCVVNHSSGKNGDDDVSNEGSIMFGTPATSLNGLTGVVSITNCLIEDGFEENFVINNQSGTISSFTMINTTIQDNSTASPGNEGFAMILDGTASLTTANITNCTFLRNRANGIHIITESAASIGSFNIGNATANSGGTFTDNNIGIHFAHNGSGSVSFSIQNATLNTSTLPTPASPININLGGNSTVAATFNGLINANTVSVPSGGVGPGMRLITNGAGTMDLDVTNNSVTTANPNLGLEFLARDGSSTLKAVITGNTVTLTNTTASHGIQINSGSTSADQTTVCAKIGGTTTAEKNTVSNAAVVNGSSHIRVRNRFAGTTFGIQGLSPAPTSDPNDAINFILARNTFSQSATVTATLSSNQFTACTP